MNVLSILPMILAFSAMSQIESPKNNVHVAPTSLSKQHSDFISEKLENDIVAIRLVTILPSQVDTLLPLDSPSTSKKVSLYSFDSAFSDSGTLAYDRLKSQATLRFSDQNALFDYLYGSIAPVQQTQDCYAPHHGVQFLDRTGKTVGFIEICFDCQKAVATEGFTTGAISSDDFLKLRALFVQYLGPAFTAYDTHQ